MRRSRRWPHTCATAGVMPPVRCRTPPCEKCATAARARTSAVSRIERTSLPGSASFPQCRPESSLRTSSGVALDCPELRIKTVVRGLTSQKLGELTGDGVAEGLERRITDIVSLTPALREAEGADLG